jgi:hypothetical protein
MATKVRRSLGASTKACRRELGWNQEELAERVAAHGDGTFEQLTDGLSRPGNDAHSRESGRMEFR